MIFFRSYRSVITPAGKVKINHGNLDATAMSAIKNGDRVTAEASQGYAIAVTPSPRLLIAWALQRRQ